MRQKPLAGPASPGKRLATVIFSGIFVLAFGAGGLLGGVLPIVDTLAMALEVRSWQAVSAQVLSADLKTHRSSKGGTTFQATTRYVYRWKGRDHEGTRIGLARWGGADNIGDWQQDWHARLTDAMNRELPVAAWIDPEHPERAVLERRPRWGLLAFHGLFAGLFTPLGIGAAYLLVRALTGRLERSDKGARNNGGTRSAATSTRGVRGRLGAEGLQFVRWWPKVTGSGVLLLTGVWLLSALQDGTAIGLGLVFEAAVALLGLVLATHLLTLFWRWRIEQGVLHVERGSWLSGRPLRVTAAELASLKQRVVYTSRTNGGPTVSHPRLELHPPGHAKPTALTPALAGPEVAQDLQAQLRKALGARG